MKALGIILVVLGIVGLIWGGVSWVHQKNVADLGPVQINTEEHHTVPIPPIAGGLMLVAGVALLMKRDRAVA